VSERGQESPASPCAVSNTGMRTSRRRRLLIIPVVLAGGFCTFLIGANYYYAQRATYLLERIRTLPLDDSAVTELKALGSEHGFRYEEATNCGKSPCIHTVAPNNLWMQHILTSRFTASLGRLLGLRAWLAVGDIELEQQQVIGKVYGSRILRRALRSGDSGNGMGGTQIRPDAVRLLPGEETSRIRLSQRRQHSFL